MTKHAKLLSITALTCALWLTLISPRALAEEKLETEVADRGVKAALEVEKIGVEAGERRILEMKKEVTFEDILKDPDNIRLNFQYARSQVKKGNVKAAVPTLERILMVRPKFAEARVFYGVVLYRLDSLQEAEQELKAAKMLKLSPRLGSEVDRYLDKIKSRRRRTQFSLRETVGFQYETNRNTAPSSDERLVSNIPSVLPPSDRKEGDTSLLNVTGLDVAHDLGFQAGHQVIGSFSYFLTEQTEVDSLDLASYRGEVGPALKTPWMNLTPTYFVTHTSLSRETFLRTQGGALSIERTLARKLRLFALGKLTRQNFSDITENLVSDERHGYQKELTLGAQYQFLPSMSLAASYSHIDKNAKESFKAHNDNQVTFGHSWLLGRGQFLLTTVELEHDDYEAPELAVSSTQRRDKTIRIRAVYGAPLTFLIDEPVSLLIGKDVLPAPLRNIVFTFTFEQFRSLSNLPNFTYRNSKFAIALSKRIDF